MTTDENRQVKQASYMVINLHTCQMLFIHSRQTNYVRKQTNHPYKIV